MTTITKPRHLFLIISVVLALLIAGCSYQANNSRRESISHDKWYWLERGNLLAELRDPVALKSSQGEHSYGPFPVEPGHYEAGIEINLEGIKLLKSQKLEEVLSIHLRLYDSTGKEISNLIAFKDQRIDGSRVDFPLHGLNQNDLEGLDGFRYLPLLARYYPWDVGWIPAGVASAKIVAALSVAGEVKLKNPSLKFSKWNLPLKERVTRTSTRKEWGLFPPKEVYKIESSAGPISFKQGEPICLNSEYWSANLKSRLISIAQNSLLSWGNLNNNCDTASNSVKLNLEKFETPAAPDSFEIAQNLESREIKVRADSLRAVAYGLDTLNNMSTASESNVEISPYNVKDFPSFVERGVSGMNRSKSAELKNEIEAIDWMPEARLNTLWIEPTERDPEWWNPKSKYQSQLKLLAKKNSQFRLLDLGLSLNPYAHRSSEALYQDLPISSEKFSNMLIAAREPYRRLDITKILLRADDFVPHVEGNIIAYALTNQLDLRQYRDLGQAHAAMFNKASEHSLISFVPPWYNNFFIGRSPLRSKNYFQSLSESYAEKINYVWTGPTVRSLQIDDFQYQRFKSFVGGNSVTLWDNTLYARKHKDFWGNHSHRFILTSMFEPFDIEISPNILKDKAFLESFYANADVSEVMRIQLATLGAFLWNPEAYIPEEALWTYLVNRFGVPGANHLLDLDFILTQIRSENLFSSKNSAQVIENLKQLGNSKLASFKASTFGDQSKLIEELSRRLDT